MIDWHSHILPAMDDGSRSLDESIQMLDEMVRQGVNTVLATPHFYANEESVDDFLRRRKESFDLLLSKAVDHDINIVCGAEVRYYSGISRTEGIDKLVIGETNLLLLEMPTEKWTDFMVRELVELANTSGLKLIIAHIERYIYLQNKESIKALDEAGILGQSNSSFFKRFGSRRKAIKLLKSGFIHFIGSDCHNMTTRPPTLDAAYRLIERKLGEDFVCLMNEYGHRALENKSKIIF